LHKRFTVVAGCSKRLLIQRIFYDTSEESTSDATVVGHGTFNLLFTQFHATHKTNSIAKVEHDMAVQFTSSVIKRDALFAWHQQ
jgi:hypothetical protein